MRSLGSNNNNSKDIETMFETGTGLAGASTVHDMQRQTRVRRSDTRNNTNYHYTDSPHDYDWDNTDAQAIMYNRYLAIQRSSLVIRLLLFAVLILLIVKIVKK
jgi:hypothetical protein